MKVRQLADFVGYDSSACSRRGGGHAELNALRQSTQYLRCSAWFDKPARESLRNAAWRSIFDWSDGFGSAPSLRTPIPSPQPPR